MDKLPPTDIISQSEITAIVLRVIKANSDTRNSAKVMRRIKENLPNDIPDKKIREAIQYIYKRT